jgi:hypothetical protein
MEENRPFMSVASVLPTPDTLASAPQSSDPFPLLNTPPFTELIKRLRILTTTLLPLEVNPQNVNDPTGRIITPSVVSAYMAAAGDLVEAVRPFLQSGCVAF